MWIMINLLNNLLLTLKNRLISILKLNMLLAARDDMSRLQIPTEIKYQRFVYGNEKVEPELDPKDWKLNGKMQGWGNQTDPRGLLFFSYFFVLWITTMATSQANTCSHASKLSIQSKFTQNPLQLPTASWNFLSQ
jgi:hypothetical protein